MNLLSLCTSQTSLFTTLILTDFAIFRTWWDHDEWSVPHKCWDHKLQKIRLSWFSPSQTPTIVSIYIGSHLIWEFSLLTTSVVFGRQLHASVLQDLCECQGGSILTEFSNHNHRCIVTNRNWQIHIIYFPVILN